MNKNIEKPNQTASNKIKQLKTSQIYGILIGRRFAIKNGGKKP
jgi:hypothetical protein